MADTKTPIRKRKTKGGAKESPILTVMRVKNEEPYLAFGLHSLRELGPVILLDDGSTDKTPQIAKSFKHVEYHRQDEQSMDEGRDRTFLYRKALERKPEWIFTLDGDEALSCGAAATMLRAVKACPSEVNVFNMYLAVMASPPGALEPKWFGPVEPIGAWSMDRMFRVRDADAEHEFTSYFKSNLHCGCVPEMRARKAQQLNLAWIEYYGYESAEAVERKRKFYSEHDPVNYPNVSELWARRAQTRPMRWAPNPDCRAMCKGRTVTY